ncbi:aspartate/glutamate racemase family protein [Campylobacter sputorum]|uniref:aspartate/glutamate racemase family protein n=1 Tax=Campylobacter sputorum TaxID=206 RepID=UPI000B7870D8|nr:amino acid racemase [Campylobacter sputorum]ASM37441.1 aspartate racemase [Campylobacter sputorum bv. faecalis CCUG 20703]
MKRIGIIGGMGPLATIDIYEKIVKLTNANKDQDNIPIVIDNYPQIPDRTAYILDNKENPYPYLKESALRLKQAGCEAICMACNTAHFFAKKLVDETGINLVHIAKNAVDSIKVEFPNAKKIAVIATTGTTKAKIYEDNLISAGYECVKISNENMQNIMDCIYKGVKANKTTEYVKLFNDTIDCIQADVYIAACTEIPLLLPYCKKKDLFVDATLELAKTIVKFSLGK